jgi:catechol 2,3-dioxygenase-like lactoylglutathione lyase family enzyme
MSGIGRFLELSVPTDDIQASLEFYQRLGFTELAVNDIRAHYYAVVTDGHYAIGLHADGFDEPALSFVLPDIAKHVRRLEDMGHEFAFVELGIDNFHEAGLCSPDGHLLRFMEARSFSPPPSDECSATAIGHSTEIALRCNDYYAAFTFWEVADFITDDDPVAAVDEREVMTLRAPGIVLGLRPGQRGREPALRFAPRDFDATLDELKLRDIRGRRSGDTWVLTAPEGTKLMLDDTR